MITNTYGGQAGDMNFPNHQMEMLNKDRDTFVEYLVEKTDVFKQEPFLGNKDGYRSGIYSLTYILNFNPDTRNDSDEVAMHIVAVLARIRARNMLSVMEYADVLCSAIEKENIRDSAVYENIIELIRLVLELDDEAFANLKGAISLTSKNFEADLVNLSSIWNLLEVPKRTDNISEA